MQRGGGGRLKRGEGGLRATGCTHQAVTCAGPQRRQEASAFGHVVRPVDMPLPRLDLLRGDGEGLLGGLGRREGAAGDEAGERGGVLEGDGEGHRAALGVDDGGVRGRVLRRAVHPLDQRLLWRRRRRWDCRQGDPLKAPEKI